MAIPQMNNAIMATLSSSAGFLKMLMKHSETVGGITNNNVITPTAWIKVTLGTSA